MRSCRRIWTKRGWAARFRFTLLQASLAAQWRPRSWPRSSHRSEASVPSVVLTAAMGMAGSLGGVIAPSRGMLVRNAAPPGAAGRAFGIVSTGFNFSGILSPLLFGWIMDQHMPHWVFGAAVAFMVLTVLLALVTDRKPQGASKA